MKKYYEFVEHGSAAWLVLREKYRRARGRRPVDGYRGEVNPRKALKMAKEDLVTEGRKFFATVVPCSREVLGKLLKLLEFKTLGKSVEEKPQHRDVKYTFMQWGLEASVDVKAK